MPDVVSEFASTGIKLLDFCLLRYSVVYTVESLSLFFLIFVLSPFYISICI